MTETETWLRRRKTELEEELRMINIALQALTTASISVSPPVVLPPPRVIPPEPICYPAEDKS